MTPALHPTPTEVAFVSPLPQWLPPTLPTNPAGRLLQLARVLQGMNPGRPATEAWAAAFGCSTNAADLFPQIAKVSQAIDVASAAVRNISTLDQNLYLSWEPPLRSLVAHTNLDAQWSHYNAALGDTVVQSLAFCDHQLSLTISEPALQTEELRQIRVDIAQLLDDIRAAVLGPDLKAYLVNELERLIEAIDDAPFLGPDTFRDAVHETIGAAVLLPDDALEDAPPDLLERVQEIVRRFDKILALPAKLSEIALNILMLTQGNSPHH
jgi:hypothetical protein